MTARPIRRAASALASIAVLLALAGCDATASAVPVSIPTAPTASPAPRCSDAATTRTGRTVAYRNLPGSLGFSRALQSAAGRTVRLPTGVTAFYDFMASTDRVAAPEITSDGGVVGPAATGLIGAGTSKSVVEVAPNTSSRAGDIPDAFPQTNQLDVLRVRSDGAVLRDFAVRGTGQGHLYNGLRIDQVHGLRASHLRVVGIPGDDIQPPGETFGVNDYRTVGSLWTDVEVDGAGVGASGFGVNSSRDITLCRVVSHDNPVAMGFAFWQSSGIRLVDCVARDNGFSGFNFERVSGTTTLIRPRASGNRYAMRIATDRVSGRYVIVDPQLTDGRWTVTLPKRWYGTTNKQKASDIRLVVEGRSRPDLLRIVRY